jgi:hypothetical protein
MVCLSGHRYTRLLAQIAALEAALDAAYETQLAVMSSQEESYTFDSKEAMQRLKNVDMDKLNLSILDMETNLEHLYQKANCKGVIRLNLRRKQRGGRVCR